MSDPAAIIREEREARDLRQSDLAALLDVTQAFVSQLERGLVELPSDAVRTKFLEHWGLDPFAERAAERDGKVSASEFSRRTRIDIHSILRLIDEEILPARFLGDGLGYELDERAALTTLQELPRCRYESCDEPATTETGCCGKHAQKVWALKARGTKRPADVVERMRLAHLATHADPERGPRWRAGISRANRGRKREDVRERVAEMHADPETHHDWRRKTMRGRLASPNPRVARPTQKTMTRVERAYNGVVGARAVGRVGGKKKGYTDGHVDLARKLKTNDPNIGRGRLAKQLKVTEEQARAILSEIKG
jgi:transcriptional regulator with XRE-family HTH domain